MMEKPNLKDLPLKPTNSSYTDGQWQAIYDSGDNILVSASAGSGKTTVLVQRVIEKIKAGINVDQLLIVTYTEAAAKEMKQRILSAVQGAITEESDLDQKRHFVKQLSLIPTAAISTLHAFCLQVIRKYYYLIEIDPVFRLLTDDTEMTLLKEDVWEELREELYEKDQRPFYQLTENFSNDRSDEGLTRLIFSLYDFARSNPSPKDWLDSLGTSYQVTDSLAEAPIYQTVLKPMLLAELVKMQTQSQQMVSLSEGEPLFEKVHALVVEENHYYTMLENSLLTDDLDGIFESLTHTIQFNRYPSLRNLEEAEKEQNETIKELRTSNKKTLETWQKGLFSVPPTKMLEVMVDSQQLVTQMAEVAFMFEQAYAARKREKNLVDFNDLEHFTLQILANYQAGEWQGTEASDYYRETFSEVLVDEYQDINQLQENILYWLRQTKDGQGNFFMVGDVKQSIYSFRLADPTLFIDKYNAFGRHENGRRIILAENFRSRSAVLDFTNLVFEQVMNTSLGQLEYDQAAQLIAGYDGFPESDAYDTELLIFENSNEEEVEVDDLDDSFQVDDKTEGELRLVGNQITRLINEEFPIYDKKKQGTRPIRYQDIVLLTPTKKNNLILLDIFKEMNIPLHVNDTQNYFQATEIRTMISLLTVIDNPYQDIPLAAVLRSPLVGLKENQLAEIRSSYPQGSFYEALLAYPNDTSEKTEKQLAQLISLFLERLLKWREMARRQQLVQLIWQIYQDTGFLDYVGGLTSGKQRQANLHALYERATSYEEMSFKGLFQFVRFIEKMQAKDKDLAEPTTIGQDEDAVRVMTIHASKGLEFPVVFVLDLTRRFNLMDLNQPYIFDAKLGAGIKFTDTENRLFYRTLPFLAIREAKRKKLLAEEMRKLYVALTRAEEKLYLVGSYKSVEEAWKKWSRSALEKETVISEELRLKGLSLMDWIGMSIMRHQDSENGQNTYEVAKIKSIYHHPAHFKLTFSNLADLRQQSLLNQQQVKVTPKALAGVPQEESLNQKELSGAIERLDYHYPYQLATQTTSYQSVSEIKRVFEDPDNVELLTLDFENGEPQNINRFAEDRLAQPKFMEDVTSPKATDIGTATHLVMQLVPLDQEVTLKSLTDLIEELVTNGAIEQKVSQEIKRDSILTFFETDFGQKLQKHHLSVIREQPFSMLMEAEALFKDYPKQAHDKVLIHGIIDGYLETESELILYDFKTDRLNSNELVDGIDKLKAKYRGQLTLYRKALEQVKNKPVTGVNLILLSENQVIELN